MPDLLTPDEVAAIAVKRDGMMHDVLPCHGNCKLCVINALLRHIAALEARTPAPATCPHKVIEAAKRVEALWAERQEMRGLERSNFSTEVAKAGIELARMILAQSPAPATDVDALLAEAKRVRGRLYDKGDIAWETFCRLATALRETLARAEKAEAERDEANSTLDMYAKAWWRELKGPYRNKRHEIDALVLTTRERLSDLAAARKELAGLGEVERECDMGSGYCWYEDCESNSCNYRHRAIRRVLEGGAERALVGEEVVV